MGWAIFRSQPGRLGKGNNMVMDGSDPASTQVKTLPYCTQGR
jgi:hypothetical protein